MHGAIQELNQTNYRLVRVLPGSLIYEYRYTCMKSLLMVWYGPFWLYSYRRSSYTPLPYKVRVLVP